MILVYTVEEDVVYLVHEQDDEEKVFRQEDNVLLAEGDQVHIAQDKITCTVAGEPIWQATLNRG